MGNLQLGLIIKNESELIPKKLNPEDPKIKAIVDQAVKDQEYILKLKVVDPQSMRIVIQL